MYRYLEHTADILIEAEGSTLEQAIRDAARAMFNIIGDASPKTEVKVVTEASNLKDLVIYFLSDLLTEMEIREMVFSDVVIERIEQLAPDKWKIIGIAKGDSVPPKDQVKAVTHHMAKVEHEDNKWVIRVLLDV